MDRHSVRIVVAVFLILMGIAALLSNLNVLAFSLYNVQWFWLVVFGLGGLLFLAAFASNTRDNWWAVIPGLTLIGLAGIIGVPFLQSGLGGGFFLGMIGLSFWVIYFTHREFWWAIIPGGVLLTLALVAGMSNANNGLDMGGFFFLGLALTFLAVYFIPTAEGRMFWAIWPAAVLGIMGAAMTIGSLSLARFAWPVILILLGGVLIYRTTRPRLQ